MDTNAAENLEGLMLQSGWRVSRRINRPKDATGSFFSVCYEVNKDGQTCFLKAFNFVSFLRMAAHQGQQTSMVDVLSEMLAAYRYERDLSALCKERKVTKVAFVRDSGEENVNGFTFPVVPYLIFDVADGGDVRSQLTFASKLEASWKLQSLHSIAVGLQQLHGIDVSHQDLKPSNVLIFNNESKIGDLGRSTCLALDSPLKNAAFTGDLHYAPPEVLYLAHDADWKKRTFASDCYLFGSLIVFYFSGLTMTALIRKHLPDSVSWDQRHSSYADVLPYVMDAFAHALDEFEQCLDAPFLKEELRALVGILCHPDPSKRSFGTGGVTTLTDKQRLVSRLDLLHKKVKYSLGR